MWYTTKIQVQQLDTFYEQVDSNNRKIASNSIEGVNKIDRTVYTFKGNLGAVFSSIEKKEPKIGDIRYIFYTRFKPYIVKKKGMFPFTKYEISWTSPYLKTYEDIAEFYKKYMCKQLPSGKRLKAEDAFI